MHAMFHVSQSLKFVFNSSVELQQDKTMSSWSFAAFFM